MPLDETKIDVLDMLERLEIRNIIPSEEEIQFSCPTDAHAHGDEKPSAYMNVETTRWYCHGCKARGSAVTFVMDILKINRMKATRWLREAYDPGSFDPADHSTEAEVKRYMSKRMQHRESYDVLLDEAHLSRFLVDWGAAYVAYNEGTAPEPLHYILDRGFSPETLDEWEFGFDDISSRICFAVRDHEHNLIGFKGRAWQKDRVPKYLVLGDKAGKAERYGFPCYHTGRVVFGLDKAREKSTVYEGGTHDQLIVCEGELNAIALWEKGFENAVAVNGSNLTQYQALMLRQYGDEIIIFFDSDEGGFTGTQILIDALASYVGVRVVPDHDGDPAEMDRDEIQECLDQAETIGRLRLVRS